MDTLIIDNYDSFTYNLYQLVAEANGKPPIVIPNDRVSWDILKQHNFDNIILSPGPGHPSHDRDFGICRQVILEANIPLLGVCLGHQGIGYFYGGTVEKAPQVMHGRSSEIYHDNSPLFHNIPSPFKAVRYHSLIVRNPLPRNLQETAQTVDGLVMALQHREKPFWGVQFHPESICTEYGQQLITNFRELTLQFWKKQNRTFYVRQKHQRKDSKSFASATPFGSIDLPSNLTASRVSRDCVHFRKLDWFRDPEDVFVGIYQNSSHSFWLDSSTNDRDKSRFSFMGDRSGSDSFEVSYQVDHQQFKISKLGKNSIHAGNIFDFLKDEIDRRYCPTPDLPFDFNCGFVGYLGYELKADCGSTNRHSSPLPDAMFLFVDRLIAFDFQERCLYLVCYVGNSDRAISQSWFDNMENQLKNISTAPRVKRKTKDCSPQFTLSRDREQYLKDIETCFQEIDRGESYEICLTDRLHTDDRPEPLSFYRILRQHNPAPYSAFLKFGEIAVVCSSPERFLRIDRERWVESKPIKGTAKRSRNLDEDWQSKETLWLSEKERSENLMIVDLLRNDLGKVCDIGTVSVPKLMEIETYSTVHQMVSTVRGKLRSNFSAIDCIRAAFPGGSMTGAPKKRTMEILDQLESEARGIYSGSLGFLGLNGTADLNIVIRTAIVTPTGTTIGVGGAIVSLSNPEAEFDEILLKARALIEAIAQTPQIELDSSEQLNTESLFEGSRSLTDIHQNVAIKQRD
ncbi:MAG TPA: aminodeoxychorismate synthase [Oscillatoriales cyanobacterium M59_W2019_021]|nr:MAG: aminodeoxychorismate synthase [Cyanobacteria bacterium J055]HIK30230.1 aminodeoxychorismate synthase [Oscillatoriales cyanobacterium M4454_W2019_049]HIK49869.1 aminodeoxychorismate synthase [Oscillatoriales cyanobacterium M59_W2019_021]